MYLSILRLYEMFSYFSVWADIQFLLCMTDLFGVSIQHRPFELQRTFLCLIIASVGGAYITYLHPRQLYVGYLDHTFKDTNLIMMDMLGHHFLTCYFFLIVMRPYEKLLIHQPKFSPFIFMLPFLYFMSGLPYDELYGLRTIDLMIFMPFAILIYYMMMTNLTNIYTVTDKLFHFGKIIHDKCTNISSILFPTFSQYRPKIS